MKKTIQDQCNAQFRNPKPFKTFLVIGSIRIPIEREAYQEWEAKLRIECDFDPAKIRQEICRRIGL